MKGGGGKGVEGVTVLPRGSAKVWSAASPDHGAYDSWYGAYGSVTLVEVPLPRCRDSAHSREVRTWRGVTSAPAHTTCRCGLRMRLGIG